MYTNPDLFPHDCKGIEKLIINETSIYWGGWSTRATVAILTSIEYCVIDGKVVPTITIDDVERIGVVKGDKEYVLAIMKRGREVMEGSTTSNTEMAEIIVNTDPRKVPRCSDCDEDLKTIYEALKMGYYIHVRIDLTSLRVIDMELINPEYARRLMDMWMRTA